MDCLGQTTQELSKSDCLPTAFAFRLSSFVFRLLNGLTGRKEAFAYISLSVAKSEKQARLKGMSFLPRVWSFKNKGLRQAMSC